MIKTICIFLLLPAICLSQTIKLSCNEKRWALFHPLAAWRIKKINGKISPLYAEVQTRAELDAYNNGGKTDAFRHVFFMAAFAQKVKVKKLRKLGIAHEKANYNTFLKSGKEESELADSLGGQMDLMNNEEGFRIGAANKKLTVDELKHLVIAEIKKGKAVIMKRDANGNYLDCNDKKIDMKLYLNKWAIPKCLVPSNSQSN